MKRRILFFTLMFSFVLVSNASSQEVKLSEKEKTLIHEIVKRAKFVEAAIDVFVDLNVRSDGKDYFPSMLAYLMQVNRFKIEKKRLTDQYTFLKKLQYHWTIPALQKLRKLPFQTLVLDKREDEYFLSALTFSLVDIELFYNMHKDDKAYQFDDTDHDFFRSALTFRQQLRELSGLELIDMIPHIVEVRQIALSRDGGLLAVATASPSIIVWDVSKKDRIKTEHTQFKPMDENPLVLDMSADGKYVAAGYSQGQLQLWDISNRLEPTPIYASNMSGRQSVSSVKFIPGDSLLVCGYDNGTWEVLDYSQPAHMEVKFREYQRSLNEIAAVGIEPGYIFVSGGEDNELFITTITRNQMRNGVPGYWSMKLNHAHNINITAVAFNKKNLSFATGGHDGKVYLWDVNDTKFFVSIPDKSDNSPLFVVGEILALAYSPDGRLFAASAKDGHLITWNVQAPLKMTMRKSIKLVKGYMTSLQFSPDGNYLFTGSSDGTVKVWKTNGQPDLSLLYLE